MPPPAIGILNEIGLIDWFQFPGTGSRPMKPSRDIARLIEIMAALRHPETGCPWDVEQDFHTISPFTIEEAYEVADAIERGDHEDLREELGDLLLQVVYHAHMAQEQELFEFGGVVEAITEKMIRRHPHVFGDEETRSAGMAKGAWRRIKELEKQQKAERRRISGLPEEKNHGILDDIPASMPALTRALKIQQKMADVGFDWDDPRAVIAKTREELDELERELEKGARSNIEAEIGDVIFSLTNLARHLDFDPETTLRLTNEKVTRRFHHIEKELAKRGISLQEATLDQMEQLWQSAKT
jgi:ATP diphosphatase